MVLANRIPTSDPVYLLHFMWSMLNLIGKKWVTWLEISNRVVKIWTKCIGLFDERFDLIGRNFFCNLLFKEIFFKYCSIKIKAKDEEGFTTTMMHKRLVFLSMKASFPGNECGSFNDALSSSCHKLDNEKQRTFDSTTRGSQMKVNYFMKLQSLKDPQIFCLIL